MKINASQNCLLTCSFASVWLTAFTSVGRSVGAEHFITPETDLKAVLQRVAAGDHLILQNGTGTTLI